MFLRTSLKVLTMYTESCTSLCKGWCEK